MSDLIYALATAPGRAAIAVFRVSGTQTDTLLNALTKHPLPQPRLASVRALYDNSGRLIDEALVLRFKGPNSFTGEDSAEFHVHGGQAVVSALVKALAEQGVRLAEPGEFTRRAFQNGRLDLTQAEAIADLVDAESDAQRQQALGQLNGALSQKYFTWRETLLNALALMEAEIDFPDEDLPGHLSARTKAPLSRLRDDLKAALDGASRGEIVRQGYQIALMGEPNAGKSTLFNALLNRDAAIVTPIAGTTRDVLEAPFHVQGYACTLFDTAGLRDTDDLVEKIGIERARHRAVSAQLRILMVDGSKPDVDLLAVKDLLCPGDLVVINKQDLGSETASSKAQELATNHGAACLRVSMAQVEGADCIRTFIFEKVVSDLSGADFPAVTRERHRERLTEALTCIERSLAIVDEAPELAAEDLRLCARAFEKVSGAVDSEQVLDVVFGSFCIGK